MRTKKITIGLFAFIALGLIYCSEKQTTQEEIVKNNAEEYIKAKMNDPETYEFAKIELIDSVSFSDNIDYEKDYFNRDMEYNRSSLESQERYKTEIPSMYNEGEVEDIKSKMEKNERILTKIDSIASQLGQRRKEVASYTYILSFRGNNALGAKVLNEYIVQTNPSPDFNIINMTDDKDKIFLTPNGFPGFKEMIEKNL